MSDPAIGQWQLQIFFISLISKAMKNFYVPLKSAWRSISLLAATVSYLTNQDWWKQLASRLVIEKTYSWDSYLKQLSLDSWKIMLLARTALYSLQLWIDDTNFSTIVAHQWRATTSMFHRSDTDTCIKEHMQLRHLASKGKIRECSLVVRRLPKDIFYLSCLLLRCEHYLLKDNFKAETSQ